VPTVSNGATLLVECLFRHGVRDVFCMPGSHSTYVVDAINEHGGIRTTLCRNEQAGAFMADGYARATGRPGVVCTTAGPGATNALTGIGEAFADSMPVLLLGGHVNHDRIHEECGRYHEMDLESVFRPCTRLSTTVMDTAGIPGVVDRAFAAMLTQRPGPAAVFLPQDLMSQPCDVAADAMPASGSRRIRANDEAVQRARALVVAAERPVIVAGGGAVSSGAGPVIEALADRLGCPIATTLNGKGLVDERREISLGHGRTRRARLTLSRADVLIAIGCRFTEVFTASGSMPIPKTIVQIDIDPRQIGINYPVAAGLEGDARTIVERLLEEIVPRETAWGDAWRRTRGAEQLKPEWLIESLRSELPEDAIVFADACEMGLRMHTDFLSYAPRTFLYPSNFAALGWGFPAAIGAAAGQPERAIACVAGDGGFVMAAQELATAVRYRLKVITVLHNDSAYGAIKAIQRVAHDGRFVESELNNPDFVALGESFGVPSVRVGDESGFTEAMRAALGREGPSLIEVRDTWRSLRV
jgi:acetolactate synthase-1/2/3 large subunit